MGGIAAELSDYTIITNDNPRWEDPEAIAEQIKAGFLKESPMVTLPCSWTGVRQFARRC